MHTHTHTALERIVRVCGSREIVSTATSAAHRSRTRPPGPTRRSTFFAVIPTYPDTFARFYHCQRCRPHFLLLIIFLTCAPNATPAYSLPLCLVRHLERVSENAVCVRFPRTFFGCCLGCREPTLFSAGPAPLLPRPLYPASTVRAYSFAQIVHILCVKYTIIVSVCVRQVLVSSSVCRRCNIRSRRISCHAINR